MNQHRNLGYFLGTKLGLRRGLDVDDARQAGLLGLARAAEDWDPAVASLGAYAFGWVRHEVSKITRRRRPVGELVADGEEHVGEPADPGDLADVLLERATDASTLRRSVAALPRLERAVASALLDETPVGEVRDALGMSSTRYVATKARALAVLAELVRAGGPAAPSEAAERSRQRRIERVRAAREAKRIAEGRPVRPRGRPRKVAPFIVTPEQAARGASASHPLRRRAEEVTETSA